MQGLRQVEEGAASHATRHKSLGEERIRCGGYARRTAASWRALIGSWRAGVAVRLGIYVYIGLGTEGSTRMKLVYHFPKREETKERGKWRTDKGGRQVVADGRGRARRHCRRHRKQKTMKRQMTDDGGIVSVRPVAGELEMAMVISVGLGKSISLLRTPLPLHLSTPEAVSEVRLGLLHDWCVHGGMRGGDDACGWWPGS